MLKQFDEDFKETCNELNEDLKKINKSVEFVVVGGQLGVYYLGVERYRTTEDIDALMISKTDNEIERVLLDHGVHKVTIIEVPPPEEMEYIDIIKLSNLKARIPEIESFAIQKLMSMREKDFQDLKNTPILDNCDLDILKEKIEYYKHDLLSNHADLNYKRFDELLAYRGIEKRH